MSVSELFALALANMTAAVATPLGVVALLRTGARAALVIVGTFVKTNDSAALPDRRGNLGFLIYGLLLPRCDAAPATGRCCPSTSTVRSRWFA